MALSLYTTEQIFDLQDFRVDSISPRQQNYGLRILHRRNLAFANQKSYLRLKHSTFNDNMSWVLRCIRCNLIFASPDAHYTFSSCSSNGVWLDEEVRIYRSSDLNHPKIIVPDIIHVNQLVVSEESGYLVTLYLGTSDTKVHLHLRIVAGKPSWFVASDVPLRSALSTIQALNLPNFKSSINPCQGIPFQRKHWLDSMSRTLLFPDSWDPLSFRIPLSFAYLENSLDSHLI